MSPEVALDWHDSSSALFWLLYFLRCRGCLASFLLLITTDGADGGVLDFSLTARLIAVPRIYCYLGGTAGFVADVVVDDGIVVDVVAVDVVDVVAATTLGAPEPRESWSTRAEEAPATSRLKVTPGVEWNRDRKGVHNGARRESD